MSKISRRTFIKNTALSAAAINYIPFSIRGSNVPSNKLNIAAVGVGGMGDYNLKNLSDENIPLLNAQSIYDRVLHFFPLPDPGKETTGCHLRFYL